MTVDPATAKNHAEYGSTTLSFCGAGCLAKFNANPENYLGGVPKPVVAAPAGAIWTCPMHPEIRRDGPGSCPICGMALEPEASSLDDVPNPELVDFTRRLWVCTVLAIPLLVLSMGAELFGLRLLNPAFSPWVQLALAAPIVLWGGWPFFARGCSNAVFQRDGEVSIAVTYMTGTLVKLGQRIADASQGGNGWAWLPYLLLWLALITGAVAGAESYARIGLASLWFAAAWAATLAVAAWRIDFRA